MKADKKRGVLRRKIEKVMHSDQAGDTSPLAAGLSIFSRIYGAAVRLRSLGYRTGYLKIRRLPCRVISVGNIAVGGTGKTPMTILLAEMLRRRGFKPAVISRGYKGGAEKRGGIVSDGRKFYMDADKTGDEPWMMAGRLQKIGVPVVVGRNRFESGSLALKAFQPDVILLDDAFQHLKLWRDLNLVLLDSACPFGNNYLLPRGILREPVSALSRGDIFILTRNQGDDQVAVDRLRNVIGNRPVYAASHRPFLSKWVPSDSIIQQALSESTTTFDLRMLQGRRVFGFSGIAGNDGFRQTLESLGCDLVGFTGFADHYQYSIDDGIALQRVAHQLGADVVCTTEKDYVRLARQMPWAVDLAVIGADMSLGNHQAAFENDVVQHLAGPINSYSDRRAP